MKKKGEFIAIRPEAIIEARYSLTNKQNDILDMLFTQIEEDEKLDYEIEVKKYKELYESDTSNLYRDLEAAVKEFENSGFYIEKKDSKKPELIYYAWFPKIHYKPGEGKIAVRIDKDVKLMFIEIKKRIYYHIKYTLNFKRRYSKRIYFYLKSFEDTGWRIDKLDELKTKLKCEDKYADFKAFKKNVLNPSQEEINDTSDLNFDYEALKTGRKITHIKWSVKGSYVAFDDNGEGEGSQEDKDENKGIVDEIKGIIGKDTTAIDCIKINSAANGNMDLIKEKYKVVMTYAKGKDIENFTGLIIAAIKEDWKLSEKKGSIFNSFKQRDYDFDDLKKKLLGWDQYD